MRKTALGVLALATAILTGCSSDNDVAPTPPATTEPTTSEIPRPTAAPPIETPVDLTPYRRPTCALLTAAQVTELGLPPQTLNGGTPESGICSWSTTEGGHDLYTLDLLLTGDPLSEAYRRSNDRLDSGKRVSELFEIRTIGGLPAVVTSMRDPSTFCAVIVGTGAGQGISITASISFNDPDPELCDRMVTAAEWVIEAARG
jgi:hypothetical protein